MVEPAKYGILEFDITNADDVANTIDLFSFEALPVPTTPGGGIYITGTALDYNQFVTLATNGTLFDVRKIKLVTKSIAVLLGSSLTLIWTNVVGQEISEPVRISSSISPFQEQAVAFINQRIVLDGFTFFSQAVIPKKTTIKMMLYYQTLDPSSVLKSKVPLQGLANTEQFVYTEEQIKDNNI